MNEFFDSEYVHIGISLLCIAWAVRKITKQRSMASQKGRRTTFQFLDNAYSYILVIVGVVIIVWSIYNIVKGA